MCTGSISHVGNDVTVRSLISVPRPRYFRFCNVLHIWTIRAIPTYRVYRLYDRDVLALENNASIYIGLFSKHYWTNFYICPLSDIEYLDTGLVYKFLTSTNITFDLNDIILYNTLVD